MKSMMYRIIIILQLILLSSSLSLSQSDSVKVKIEVITHELDDTSAVYIAGNDTKLGRWHPGKIQLDKAGDRWRKDFIFKRGKNLEFKFTLGTWATEALNDDSSRPSNNYLDVENDTILTYTINVWNRQENVEPVLQGQVTGKLEYHRNLKMEGLEPRNVIVWLPPGYEKDERRYYPVYYMHDGQNMFDPKTSAFGIDWQIDEAADSLIRKGEIKPMIIVGITNTINRSSEYLPSDTSKLYMDFVVNIVKPFIDSRYRTKPDRNHTLTGGSSAGGTISFMLLWERNDIFSKAICMSPAFYSKEDSIDIFSTIANYEGERRDIHLYFDNGGKGIDKKLLEGMDMMIDFLNKQRYKEGEDYMFVIDREAGHSEVEWAKRIPDALRFMSRY